MAAFEEVTASNAGTCSDTPTMIVRHGSAGNDAVISEDYAEPRAPPAFAANRFGDVATTDSTMSVRPTSYELYRAARAHRSLVLGEMIHAAIQAVAAIVGRAYARQRQPLRAGAIYNALRKLDNRALRDMGFDRSEIRSVAAEMTGQAEQTRVRVSILGETPDRSYWTRYDHFMAERQAHTRRSG